MAVDQNFAPKDLRPLNPSYNPSATPSSISPTADMPAAPAADDLCGRKVKLLCSFGGKILPRPSDGALRYAGGQTRIIAVRREATFPELYRKMAEACGGPVAVRYQLPDEELDALVSVSSAEDLDNMMDEYDKLADASGDGSAKLRVFLFSPSEIASASVGFSAGPAVSDPYDGGQRYIEAINCAAASETVGGFYRKGSNASASSTQNSDAGGDGSNNEGASPTVRSPSAAAASVSHDPSGVAFVGTAVSLPMPEGHGFVRSPAVLGQTMVSAQTLNPPPVAQNTSQAYVDPHQVHYITPQSVAMANASRQINLVAVPQNPYLPTMQFSPAITSSQVGTLKQAHGHLVTDQNYKVFKHSLSQFPPLHPAYMQPQNIELYGMHPPHPLPNGQGLRFEHCQMCQKALPHAHSDPVINAQGNLSGVSIPDVNPVLQAHQSEDIKRLQAQHRAATLVMENLAEPNAERIVNLDGAYGVDQTPEQIMEKDRLVVPKEILDHSKVKQPLPPFSGDTQASYGVFVDPPLCSHAGSLHGKHFDQGKVFNLPVTIGLPNTAQASFEVSLNPPCSGFEGSLQHQNVMQAENFGHAKILPTSGTMGLISTAQTSYGMPPSHPQPQHDDSLLQQLLQFSQGIAQPSYPIKQDVPDSLSMKNIHYQAPELVNQDSIPVLFHTYAKAVDGMTEAINVSNFENLRLNDQSKPTFAPILDVSKDMKPENSLAVEQNHTIRPQNGTNMVASSYAVVSSEIVPERISAGQVNPMVSNIGISKDIKPESYSVVGESDKKVRLQNGQIVNPGALTEANLSTAMDHVHLSSSQNTNNTHASGSCFGRGIKPAMPSGFMPGMSTYPTGSAHGSIITKVPSGELKDEGSHFHPKDLHNDMAALPRSNVPFQISSLNNASGNLEQCPSAFKSLFCNQDPWKILESAHMILPRPTILASRESLVSENMLIENLLPNSKDPDIAVLLEEGALQPHKDLSNEDLLAESLRARQDLGADLGADYIKQDLHDLAKQVGESVLQPSVMPREPKESNFEPYNESRISEDKSNFHSEAVLYPEDNKVRQSDKLHSGFLLADDIGRLQIIKNCDLEELQELGSGTFGTVYHGKWRGSDVAIKRINDRCFAGKPSEQERMRADFWNEASKLADLHHPNLVAFYGIVLDGPGGSFATVTEYMVNGSLRYSLQRNDKTFDRRKRLLIAMDVAFGMEYLHGKSIVHFDLKSDNLLVNLRDPQRPICKVGDLGLSKVKCKTLISGGVRGTLPWMAPELLNGSSNLVSEKVDVFSYGIVMWELLTGSEPYADLHYGAIIGGIVSNTLRPAVPEPCDPEWRALMQQCWSAEASERPSFTEIANRLRSMATSLSQKAQAPSSGQPQTHK